MRVLLFLNLLETSVDRRGRTSYIRDVAKSERIAEGNRASVPSLPEASLLISLLEITGLSVGRELVRSVTLVDCEFRVVDQ